MLTTTPLSDASGSKKNPIEWIVFGKDKDIIITVNNVEEKMLFKRVKNYFISF